MLYNPFDILAVLYTNINIDPKDPNNDARDRFILSKGHAGAAVYAVLAELGFFSKKILDYLNNLKFGKIDDKFDWVNKL